MVKSKVKQSEALSQSNPSSLNTSKWVHASWIGSWHNSMTGELTSIFSLLGGLLSFAWINFINSVEFKIHFCTFIPVFAINLLAPLWILKLYPRNEYHEECPSMSPVSATGHILKCNRMSNNIGTQLGPVKKQSLREWDSILSLAEPSYATQIFIVSLSCLTTAWWGR